MHRTLPALMIILTLAACSSSTTTTTSTSGASGNGPGGSVTGGTTSAGATGSATGNPTGSATGNPTGSATGNPTAGASGSSSTGGSQGTATGGNGGTVTVDNFNSLFNQAICKFIDNCQGFPPSAPYVIGGLCPLSVELDLSSFPLAVDAGRVYFDSAQATSCIAGLNADGCAITQILPCLPFLGGTDGLVPPAGACYANADCLSQKCTGSISSTCTPGTCAGLVGNGGGCNCPNCGVCDADAGLSCVSSSKTCAANAQPGQACGSGDSNCASDVACVNDVCTTVPMTAGNPCGPNSFGECASGLYCFEKSNASFGNCATRVAAGQPCGEDADHLSNAFTEGDSECAGLHPVCLGAGTLMDSGVAIGTCAEFSDVGGSCTPPSAAINAGDPYNNGCYAGLNCVTGACVKPPSSGACSTNGIPCDTTQSYCASASSTCKSFIGLGGTCTGVDTGECGPSASCGTNNICQGFAASCSPTL